MNKHITFKKEFDNIYRQKVVKYFDKYFSDKKIDEAIFDAFKDGTIKLFRVYVEFCMICECLELVIGGEKIPDKGKKLINKILLRTVEIKTDIESIITYIIDIILA